MCNNNTQDFDKIAVENFQAYLKIPTITGETDYCKAVEFLKCLASKVPLDVCVVNVCKNRPVVIMKWPGTVCCSQSIVLNSHMDVVPADEENWEYPPFGGCIDKCGRIHGRGSQDMKLNAIQYIEAVRRLKADGCKLKRTIIILFVPDEESGSQEGMKRFVDMCEFKELNIGFWLDESAASECKKGYILYNGEKHKCVVKFCLEGCGGQPWMNTPNPPAEKLAKLLTIIYEFRKCEVEKSGCDPNCQNVITLNVTNIESEAEENMLPCKYIVTVDARLPPDTCLDNWKSTLKSWCCQIGEGCCMKEDVCELLDKPTPLENRFYAPILETVNEMCFELQPKINPGTSAARFVRNLCIPAFGLSCLNGVTCEKHGANEFIEKEKFLQGIQVYYNLLKKIGNMPC